VPYRDLFNI